GSLLCADAWNNMCFTAAEVKNPKRDVALSMAFGTIIVITLYCLANLAYLCTLPLVQIQTAPDDRVASAALNAIFGPTGAMIMAVAIIIAPLGRTEEDTSELQYPDDHVLHLLSENINYTH